MCADSLLKETLDLLLPRSCLVCARAMRRGEVCRSCKPEEVFLFISARCHTCFSPTIDLDASMRCAACRAFPLPFGLLRYLWDYSGNTREIIQIMKYRPSFRLARFLAALAAEKLQPLVDARAMRWDLITVVPSSGNSLAARGFNQCVPLALAIRQKLAAQSLFKPCISFDALLHSSKKKPQASLPHDRRIANARNSFRAAAAQVSDRNVLLVEDVITTGATSSAAALALYQAGASRVDLFALARSASWLEFRAEIYKKMRVS